MLFLKNNYKFKNIAGTPIKNTFAIKSRLNCNTAGTIKTKKVINKTMQTLMSYGFKNLQVFDTLSQISQMQDFKVLQETFDTNSNL